MAEKFASVLYTMKFLTLIVFSLTVGSTRTENVDYTEKISDNLWVRFEGQHVSQAKPKRTEVIVELHDPSDTGQGKSLFNTDHEVKSVLHDLQTKAHNPEERHSARVTELMHRLQVKMTKRLSPAVTVLSERKCDFECLWATGEVYIPAATWADIERIAQIKEVKSVRSPGVFSFAPPMLSGTGRPSIKKNTTWPLAMSDARCSEITCLGEGVTIGFIDTGAMTTHQEIRKNWIGMPYGFYDGAHPTVNCTARDADGHGTHVVGIAVGATVGVAPNATWMMCMGCTFTNCSEAAVKICGQYLTCPWECGDTSLHKDTKNCSKRPDIVSNSWSMSHFERLVMPDDFYYPVLELWNSLGIISTFSAGNSGPSCNSLNPPAAYDISLAVGAVDINATLARFSAVGPQLSKRPLTRNTTASGTCERNECTSPHSQKTACSLIKPDIAAPGVKYNSSFIWSNSSYREISGTSMSTPHVAGVIALMKCANRRLHWNYKLAYKLLTSTANTDKIDLLATGHSKNSRYAADTNLMCNAKLSHICNSYPNNMYGHGLVNACRAVIATKMENVYSYP